MRDITIGQYYEADSIIHRLDPRTKLMGVLVYIILLFTVRTPILYLPILILVLALYRVAKVPFSFYLKGLQGIIFLLLFTFLFRMLYTPGDVWVTFGRFSITHQGVSRAIAMTARIALMITGASLLSYTSTPKELADGIEKAFSFLEKFHIPVHDMAVITMIAFRFIPILLEELNLLMDARAARGAKFEEANVIEKCKAVLSLLFPLFLSTLNKASDLAMAMEARGYTGRSHTGRMYPLRYQKSDAIGYFLIFLTFALFILARIRF